jgi:thioredoxin reductase (NADPH)
MEKIYDVIIIGGGPAGMSAALYAGRARLSALMIEKLTEGGQLAVTGEIENYPGALAQETGAALIERMAAQVLKFGTVTVKETVTDVSLSAEIKVVTTCSGVYKARTVIIATGANPRPIGCPGEAELSGRGVSYCATCDGAFFEDLDIYVVGGGDSAVEEALHLTRFGRKVTIIHRRDELRATKLLQERAFANEKIDFMWNTVVVEIKGGELVEGMVVKDTITGELREVAANEEDGTFGIFVFVGFLPASGLFAGKVDMKDGYIITNDNMETNISGVFAAGDIRVKTLRQVVTAAADGAIAAVMADRFINH